MGVSLEDLMNKIDSRYKLTLAAAQRANELTLGAPLTAEVKSKKPAVMALEEISKGKVRIEPKPEKAKKS